jgi:hypothetical protein
VVEEGLKEEEQPDREEEEQEILVHLLIYLLKTQQLTLEVEVAEEEMLLPVQVVKV